MGNLTMTEARMLCDLAREALEAEARRVRAAMSVEFDVDAFSTTMAHSEKAYYDFCKSVYSFAETPGGWTPDPGHMALPVVENGGTAA